MAHSLAHKSTPIVGVNEAPVSEGLGARVSRHRQVARWVALAALDVSEGRVALPGW